MFNQFAGIMFRCVREYSEGENDPFWPSERSFRPHDVTNGE
jgi:hypothetical protein